MKTEDFFPALRDIFTFDPGKRGLASIAPPPDFAALAHTLKDSKRVIILTGFPILSAQKGETDGPPGAVAMAYALKKAGKDVRLVTDDVCAPPLVAARDTACHDVPLTVVFRDNPAARCAELLADFAPDLIISIERPGKCRGHFHNMKGNLVDHLIADTDSLFSAFSGAKIAIGDGGNELGMYNLKDAVLASVGNGADILCDLGCDFALAAGVSNWWGWGIAAMLSVIYGQDLLFSEQTEWDILKATVDAGAVDGMSATPRLTVDGLDFETNLAVLRRIKDAAHPYIRERISHNG